MMLLQDQFSRPFLDMLHHAASTTPPLTFTAWHTSPKVIDLAKWIFQSDGIHAQQTDKDFHFFGLPMIATDLPETRVVLRAGQNTVGTFDIDLDFYADQIKANAGAM